jgi:exosortase
VAVLLLAAWLVYRRWHRLLALPAGSGSPWLAAAIGGVAAAILAWAKFVGANDLRVPALMATVVATGAVFGGARGARILLLPSAILLFAMPAPAPLLNAVLFKYQFWTAEFAGLILHAMGLSAFVAGDQILRAGNNFAIVESCSGVRITETLTMLTILMLDLFRRRPLHSVILLALAPVVAFLCNGVRAVTLILNPAADIAEVHTLQGIGMLLGGLIVLYGIDGLLGRVLPDAPSGAAPRVEPAPTGGRPDALGAAARAARAATVGMALLAVISLAVPEWSGDESDASAFPRVPLATSDFATLAGWSSQEQPVDRRFQGRIGLQRDLSRRYDLGRGSVYLYVAAGDRAYRPRSVLFSKAELPGRGWNTHEQGRFELDAERTDVTWRVAVSGTKRWLIWSWQEDADGLWVESLRSLLALDSSPFRRAGEPLLVRMATRMIGTEPEHRASAEARMRQFYAELRPSLDAQRALLRGDTG